MKLVKLTPEGKTHLPGKEVIFGNQKIPSAGCNKSNRFGGQVGHPFYVEGDVPTCEKCASKNLKAFYAMLKSA